MRLSDSALRMRAKYIPYKFARISIRTQFLSGLAIKILNKCEYIVRMSSLNVCGLLKCSYMQTQLYYTHTQQVDKLFHEYKKWYLCESSLRRVMRDYLVWAFVDARSTAHRSRGIFDLSACARLHHIAVKVSGFSHVYK